MKRLFGLSDILQKMKQKLCSWFLKSRQPVNQTQAAVIYDTAVRNLGKQLTLDASIPDDVRCAEAVSDILKQSGYPVPTGGIKTVNAIIDFCLANGFTEVKEPAPGNIVTAHSSNRNDPNYAHTGICLKYGIASNTSFPVAGFKPGEFAENYKYPSFINFFQNHGSVIRYFSPTSYQHPIS